MEAAIAQIWSDLLGLEPIGIHDHFRDLGGDSIMAAHVALRLSERLGINITPEALLERPTIAELAPHLAGPGPPVTAHGLDAIDNTANMFSGKLSPFP